MKAAVSLFPESMIKLPCAAHRLHLTIKDLFNPKNISLDLKTNEYYIYDYNDEYQLKKIHISTEKMNELQKMNSIKSNINTIVSKCKHLVGSFRFSEQLTRKFKEKQKELKIEDPIKLIQDVPTRWNSTLDMFLSIVVNEAL